MTPQKQYRVTFYYTEGGSIILPAQSGEEAEKQLLRLLEEDGLEGLADFKVVHREYDTVESEELI